MRITAGWLRGHKACIGQVALFKAEWPKGGDINEANLIRAWELGLDLEWLYRKLSPSSFAQAEYDRAAIRAWVRYDRSQTTAEKARIEYDWIRRGALIQAILKLGAATQEAL